MQFFLHQPTRHKRSGQAVVESVFAIILFVIMLVLICTVCVYLYLQFNLITAAREGARAAATDLNYKTNNNAAVETKVIQKVQNYFAAATGQTISAGDIQVTPPTGDIGSRNVTVTVNFTFQNPLNVVGFLQGLGASGSQTSMMDNVSMTATATMRYEE